MMKSQVITYFLMLALPIGALQLSSIWVLSQVDITTIPIEYPTIAVLALVLELSVPFAIVSGRKRPIFFVAVLLRSALFHLFYSLLSIIVFISAMQIVGAQLHASLATLQLFFVFLIYSYVNLLFAISRALTDRAGNLRFSLIARYLSNVASVIGIVVTYYGFSLIYSLMAVTLIRAVYVVSMAFKIWRRVFGQESSAIKLSEAPHLYYLLKLSVNSFLVFLLGGIATRLLLSALVPTPAFSYYIVAMEMSVRISGFLINGVQPFIKTVAKYVTKLFWMPLLFSLIYFSVGDEFITIDIALLSCFIFLTGVRCQELLSLNRLWVRAFVPLLEFFLIATAVAISVGFIFDSVSAKALVSILIMCQCLTFLLLGQTVRRTEFAD